VAAQAELTPSTRAARAVRFVSWARIDLPLVLLDCVMVVAVYVLLLEARFDFSTPDTYWSRMRYFLPAACVVYVGAMAVCGGYGRTWRHASVDEARRLLGAVLIGAVVLLGAFMWVPVRIPISVLLAGPFLVTFLFGALRFHSRLFAFQRNRERSGARVALIGAGHTGDVALRAMHDHPELGLLPVVVVDDDPRLQRRSIRGVPIAGAISDLSELIAAYDVHEVLLAITEPSRDVTWRVVEAAGESGIPVRVLPAPSSWVHGTPSLRDARDLNIEDLLGRREVNIDLIAVSELIRGRRVLITGGGGWIGSEIARQVSAFEPASLVLLDHDETHLHDAVQNAGSHGTKCVLADIRDASVLEAAFSAAQPEIVFHAAAHKHVPMLQDFACEAVRTNIFGTQNVVDACIRCGVTHLVCISTDKAAIPNNVMAASKWLAEQIVIARSPGDARFCSVRFGNVLGSRGSVIPTFQRQIAAGGPVTVTDRRMNRYFMSTDEAVRLVLLAGTVHPSGEVLALEMGERVNIYELAERMILLCGHRPGQDIEIQLTGIRKGENLDEILIGPAERQAPTVWGPILSIAPVRLPADVLADSLAELERLALVGDHDAARRLLLGVAAPSLEDATIPGNSSARLS
jgi:FlaA1/EpsC-like NDP-sugar epimerase